eukprot:gb/GECG01004760.1/.p1 GENE.gb/GECG01004760.1/~~gb/GECG01004760.1/.p1  ORF type:complete len:110 (+),score=14.99 gb/GECG01004760.1/:1-330(+)
MAVGALVCVIQLLCQKTEERKTYSKQTDTMEGRLATLLNCSYNIDDSRRAKEVRKNLSTADAFDNELSSHCIPTCDWYNSKRSVNGSFCEQKERRSPLALFSSKTQSKR